MALLLLYILGLLITLVCGAPPQKKRDFPYPVLNAVEPPYDSSTPYYQADGLDYDDMPSPFNAGNSDCFGEHLKCIRNRNYFYMVCVWAWYSTTWENHIYSQCQMRLTQCKERLHNRYGVYGTHHHNDKILYQGDGWGCKASLNKDRGSFDSAPAD